MNTRFKSLNKYTDARTAYRLANSVIREFANKPVSEVNNEQLLRVIDARKALNALEMLTSNNSEGWEKYLTAEQSFARVNPMQSMSMSYRVRNRRLFLVTQAWEQEN